MQQVQVVARSGNAKTGPIPVTYRPMATCEPTCPLLGSGCYGSGRIFAMAERNARDLVAEDAAAVLAKRHPSARYMRDRVVGDIITMGPDGPTLDLEYVDQVAKLARDADLVAFGYTHAWRRFTIANVERIERAGYVMNASCETPGDIAQAAALGLPTTVANDDIPEGAVIAGRRVVTCPAQTRDGVTCATCGLCAKPGRKSTVRFRIHGSAKRQAQAAVARRMEGESR